jgi:hypothetical protein
MNHRWMHACFAALALAGATASLAAGCSSNNPPPAAPSGLSQCPLTLDEANGAPCEGSLLCPYEFPCGAFHQQTTCLCTAGAMACTVDATDASLAPDATPTCVSVGNAAACPPSEPASLATCTTIGLQCEYHGLTCPGSAEAGTGPNIDTCECQGGTNGGLVFNCAISECTPSEAGVGTPSDAGPDGASGDAGDGGGSESDASQDAGDDGG